MRLLRATLALVAFGATACALPGQARPAPPDAVEAAAPGGVLTIAITPPAGIDPLLTHEPAARLVSGLACQTLIVHDPVTGELRPGLAESWVVADGGGAIMIKLRKDLKFSDGTELTSREVVESLRRLANPESVSYLADLLSPIAGYAQFREQVEAGDPSALAFRGARVVEPLSFEIFFDTGARPDFVGVLAHPATAPVQTRAARADPVAFERKPVCAGPYAVAAPFTPGDDAIRLVRKTSTEMASPAYTSGGRGYAEEIVFRVYPDAEATYHAWIAGEVDVAAVPEPKFAEAAGAHPDDIVTGPSPQIEFIGLPYGQESPFTDAALRQSMAAAIDRKAIALEVYGGARAPATGFLAPALGDVHRDDACSFAAPASRPEIPAQPVKLYFNDEFAHRRLADAIARMWQERLGLQVELQPMNWDEYLMKATTGAGYDGAFRVSWTPRYLSGLEYLGPLFHSQYIGDSNLQRYADATYDLAFTRDTARIGDDGDRVLAMQDLEDKLCRDLPLIPVVFNQSHVLVRAERVGVARPDGRAVGLDGLPLLQELYVRGQG